MKIEEYEREHLSKIKTHITLSLAIFFFILFIAACMFIYLFPMVGILDYKYPPGFIGISSFVLSVIFSAIKLKTTAGKVLFILNIMLMLFMITLGP